MEAKDKIIVALDVSSLYEAGPLVETLAPHVGCFKVGLEFITAVGLPTIISWFTEGCPGGPSKVFLDGKFKDIPNTVAGAARVAANLGVRMFNVHCLGGLAMMEAAKQASVEAAEQEGFKPPIVLGVTILTSLDYRILKEMGFFESAPELYGLEWAQFGQGKVQELVLRLASLARKAGLDGVIASAKEATAIRETHGKDFLIVTPGIRPTWAAAGDQKRVTTPTEAIKAGADYLVIGRPITKPPAGIGTPVDAAKRIAEEIASVLRKGD